MPVEVRRATSLSEIIDHLDTLSGRAKTIWFRGHADARWRLEPSLARQDKLSSENQLTKRFKQNAFQFLQRVPTEEWEWMFLMQHYGVPTRLLDWTESPLVGLYFALQEDGFSLGTRRPPAALWCLFPRKLNELSGLVLNPPDDIPAFGDEEELKDYLPSRVHGAGTASKNPLAIIAPRQFGRVYAQQGVFTILHRESRNIEDLTDGPDRSNHLVQIVIPRTAAHRIRKEIALLRITKLTVFPQLENVAEEAIRGL
jgi:hypothetical protein